MPLKSKPKEQPPPTPIIAEQGRAIMQAVPDLVFFLDLDGRYIEICSARDEDLFMPREELIGKSVLEVLPPPIGEDCMQAIRKLSSTSDVTSFSYSFDINNQPRWFEGRVTLCGTNSVLVLVRDFTEQHLAEDALNKANYKLELRAQQLQKLGRELTEVEHRERKRMAHILHDSLQQLLVGAKFHVAILAKKASTDIELSAAKTVNHVLDEAIRQSQNLTVNLCPPIFYEGTLSQALRWVAAQMLDLHGLTVEIEPFSPIPLKAEEDIRIVLFNAVKELLFNVVKHADTNKASIAVTRPTESQLCITVIDKGVGFDTNKANEMRSESCGFGLLAIHERIDSLGGSLNITSSPSAGTQASITVPIDKTSKTIPAGDYSATPTPHCAETKAIYSSKPSDIPAQKTIQILLVDDHPVMREGLKQLMQDEPGLSIIGEASDGFMAIEMARLRQPDVILMDISMPGMNGVEATKVIHSEFPDISIIGLSMYKESERADEMLAAGAKAYVTKSDAAEHIFGAIFSV